MKSWLRETMIKRGQSTPTTGSFMTDKADADQVGTIAATARERLIKIWWHSVVVPPSATFVLESGPACGF